MLRFKDITFQYAGEPDAIFQNLSFTVQKGEFISIIGSSGCGKSTIFRLVNGLEVPQCGTILVNEGDIRSQSRYSGFMPQKDLLFPWRTVAENLSLPLELQNIPKSRRLEQIKELLHTVGLSDYFDKYPKDLSGGMRQRISFARTLLTGCELLLLDEPFSALDSLTKMELQEWLLKQWKTFHRTILFVTHDVEEAIFLSSKIFLLPEPPVTSIEEILVPLSYPHSRNQLLEPSILSLRQSLIQKLRRGGERNVC